MHFATTAVTAILAATVHAAELEAESNFLAAYEAQYGLGLGHGPAGPSLSPLGGSYAAPSLGSYDYRGSLTGAIPRLAEITGEVGLRLLDYNTVNDYTYGRY